MKRYILVLMMVLFALAGGEDRIYQTYYNDGTQNLFPDSCSIELYFNGAIVDSVCIDSTANWQEGNRILICTLSTTDKGEHWILETFVEGTDTSSNIVLWDNDYDTIQRVAALEASITTLRDTTNAIHDTLQDGANGILADVKAISTDQTAANNLEAMLDGDRAKLYLSQLNIVASGNDDAITATGSGTGDGMDLRGGATDGSGLIAEGGANGGAGIAARAYAANFHDIHLFGDTIIQGIVQRTDSIGAGGVDAVWNEDTTAHYTSPHMAYAASQTAAAFTIDEIWEYDTSNISGAAAVGTMLKDTSAFQGAAAGVTQDGIVGALLDSGMVTYSLGADSVLRLRSLIIVDTLSSDSLPAFYVTGDDGTVWFRSRGDNTALSLTHADSTAAAALYVYGGYGNAMQIGSQGPSDEHTVHIYNNGEGDGMRIACGNNNDSGTVLNLVHAGTDSSYSTMALQTEGLVYIHGRSDRHEDGLRIHAYHQGKPVYIWGDTVPSYWNTSAADSPAVRFPSGMVTDITGKIDSVGSVDTVLSTITASASLTGTGPYGLTIYAIDTSGTDDTVSSRMLSVYDATGSRVGYAPTQSNGSIRFGLDSGTYIVKSPTVGGYYWDSVVCLVDAADTIFDITGWNIAIGAPSGDSLCRVYGYAYGPDGNALEGAIVTWQITGRNIWDICNGTSINKSNGSTTSDSTGLWTLDLLYSICLQRSASGTDSIAYKFNIDYPSGLPVVNQTFYVPAADSAEFTW